MSLTLRREIENEILSAILRRKKTPRPSLPPVGRPGFLSNTALFSALLQHGLLFAPRLLLAAQMNERQRQASVTMRTRVVASECHLRDRFLVSHRGAAQVLDASPFRLTSEPSPSKRFDMVVDRSVTRVLFVRCSQFCYAHCTLKKKNVRGLGVPPFQVIQ